MSHGVGQAAASRCLFGSGVLASSTKTYAWHAVECWHVMSTGMHSGHTLVGSNVAATGAEGLGEGAHGYGHIRSRGAAVLDHAPAQYHPWPRCCVPHPGTGMPAQGQRFKVLLLTPPPSLLLDLSALSLKHRPDCTDQGLKAIAQPGVCKPDLHGMTQLLWTQPQQRAIHERMPHHLSSPHACRI